MDSNFIKDVMEQVKGFADEVSAGMQEQYSGTPLHHVTPTDAEFKVWFEMQNASDPNWAVALPFAQGGREIINRYLRIVGRMQGMG